MSEHGVIFLGAVRQPMKFDTRNQNTLLPLGGYPSLLKQQLRDLVLRRKSLVREEPEDEAAFEAQLLLRLQSGSVVNTQLKTGIFRKARSIPVLNYGSLIRFPNPKNWFQLVL